jgi:predicted signal transduction protein with EAL and GGDEF domain
MCQNAHTATQLPCSVYTHWLSSRTRAAVFESKQRTHSCIAVSSSSSATTVQVSQYGQVYVHSFVLLYFGAGGTITAGTLCLITSCAAAAAAAAVVVGMLILYMCTSTSVNHCFSGNVDIS